MKQIIRWCLVCMSVVLLTAAKPGGPSLKRIYFNLYTDSLKPVLNYYVNVEGEFSDGSFLPLDTSTIYLTSDKGTLRGNEWIIPSVIDFGNVSFRATSKINPKLRDSVTIWIQRYKDPRDAPDYHDPAEELDRAVRRNKR